MYNAHAKPLSIRNLAAVRWSEATFGSNIGSWPLYCCTDTISMCSGHCSALTYCRTYCPGERRGLSADSSIYTASIGVHGCSSGERPTAIRIYTVHGAWLGMRSRKQNEHVLLFTTVYKCNKQGSAEEFVRHAAPSSVYSRHVWVSMEHSELERAIWVLVFGANRGHCIQSWVPAKTNLSYTSRLWTLFTAESTPTLLYTR